MAGARRERIAPAVVFLGAAAVGALVAASACQPAASPALVHLNGVAPEVAMAVRAAEQQVSAHPKSASDWLSLGMVCEANGLFGDARAAYERARSLDSNQPRVWYRLAILRARTGETDGALEAIDRTIALDGSYAPAFWRKGLILLDRADASGAHAAFEKAASLDPSNPGGVLGLARVALQQQRPADAADSLERFLSQHPGDGYALRLLGTAYQRLGRSDEAQYALAIGEGEPVWPDPWSDEVQGRRVGFAQRLKDATGQLLSGNYAAAIPLLERLSQERPDDVGLMQQLGLSYVAAGRGAEGLTVLRRALERDPNNLETHLRLSSAYLNTHDYAQALVHAERAVALSPELGRAHEAKGMALWRSEHPAEAYTAFQQALRYDPTNVSAHIWMGWILLEGGRTSDAAPHFDEAARRSPMLADAFVGLGIVSLQRGRLDEAEQALQRAAKLEPNNPRLSQARAQLDAMKSRSGGRE